MDRRYAPREGRGFLVFGALSLSLHVAAFAAFRAHASVSALAFDAASQTLAGETLEVEAVPPSSPDEGSVDPTAVTTPAVATPTATRTPPGHSSAAISASKARAPALFGAVGVRFATDLATTFTRAFPQAASADPTWSSVPFGGAGRADVELVLDDEGHLASSEIAGFPSAALRGSIERTLALLATRAFTARGAATKLRVSALVSRDDVHDGLHGDVFALSAGSFSGDVGAAFFTLPPAAGAGRRVDVEVRLLP